MNNNKGDYSFPLDFKSRDYLPPPWGIKIVGIREAFGDLADKGVELIKNKRLVWEKYRDDDAFVRDIFFKSVNINKRPTAGSRPEVYRIELTNIISKKKREFNEQKRRNMIYRLDIILSFLDSSKYYVM